jgi:uncharacterized membrane protein YdbT with pleckstrin-like domain
MGTYLLGQGEQEVKVENPTWMMLLGHIILTVLTLGIWSPILIYYVLRRSTSRYILTNRRVILEYGILNKSSKEASLDKIHNVSHTATIVERIFGYGSVQLQTASEMGATVLKWVPAPIQFKSEIINQIDLFKKAEIQQQARVMADAIGGSNTQQSEGGNLVSQLERLADLKEKGVLSDDEFEKQKARLLGS